MSVKEEERLDRFFRELKAALDARTPEERAEDKAEIAAWDNTLLDGLEDEPPYPEIPPSKPPK